MASATQTAAVAAIARACEQLDCAAVAAVMRDNADDADVQMDGFKAFALLLGDDAAAAGSGGVVAAPAVAVVSPPAAAGVIEAVAGAMQRHAEHRLLQLYATGTLLFLCRGNDANLAVAGETGAIEAVLEALHGARAEVATVAFTVFSTLHSLCRYSPNAVKARAAGAISACVAAIRVHSADDERVQIVGLQAIFIVLGQEMPPLEPDAVDLVAVTLRRSASADVQELCCALLAHLAANAQNAAHAVRAGAVEATVPLLALGSAKISMLKCACCALGIFGSLPQGAAVAVRLVPSTSSLRWLELMSAMRRCNLLAVVRCTAWLCTALALQPPRCVLALLRLRRRHSAHIKRPWSLTPRN
jgi:hypothetical protein